MQSTTHILHEVIDESVCPQAASDAGPSTKSGTSPDSTARAEELEASEHSSVAWEIEARLIAGQGVEQIAKRLDLTPDVIADHIATHFDFRHGLGRDTWMFLNAVQGPMTPGEELTEGDIWRFVAWLYGPFGIDLMVDDYYGRTDPENTRATLYAGLLRAHAVQRFVDPRSKAYADAIRQIRKRFSRRREASAKTIVAYCDLHLLKAGWNPKGKGRLTSKARREAIDKLTDEQLAEEIQKAWDKIKELR